MLAGQRGFRLSGKEVGTRSTASGLAEAQASMAGVRVLGVLGSEEPEGPLSLMTKARLSFLWNPVATGVVGVEL